MSDEDDFMKLCFRIGLLLGAIAGFLYGIIRAVSDYDHMSLGLALASPFIAMFGLSLAGGVFGVLLGLFLLMMFYLIGFMILPFVWIFSQIYQLFYGDDDTLP